MKGSDNNSNAATYAWVVLEQEEDAAIEAVRDNVHGRNSSEDVVPRWKLMSKRSGFCKDISNG